MTKLVVSSLVGVSTLGGAIVGGYYFMQPNNIKDALQAESIIILDTESNQEQWEKLAEKHTGQTVTVKLDKDIQIATIASIGDISSKTPENITKLKDHCKELLKKPAKGSDYETNKEAAKNWCTLESPMLKEEATPKPVVAQSLRQALSTEGFEALNTDSGADDVTWGKLIDKHLETGSSTITKINIPNLKTNDPSNNRVNNIEALKQACKTMLDKTTDYESDKEIAKNWCNKNTKIVS
ncbi:hypothetical protein A6V39_00230 [Candidatus Mycoplasma haematobovis]|uniref:Uncharacterized protein n=1 Tax=Candidatus Mycoplasma haematobovis TaxID=432608 RepID=A0A1A9QEV0_9MOLU|nr:hypothetical protein [Candidatus Mycoplasma haematobovis]OAL10476.1 hypothetical protein A6V39_00230 [Candidatus Mycoplasma haematobovis]